jgi:hypothetical protein
MMAGERYYKFLPVAIMGIWDCGLRMCANAGFGNPGYVARLGKRIPMIVPTPLFLETIIGGVERGMKRLGIDRVRRSR